VRTSHRSFRRSSGRPRRRVIWAEYDAVTTFTANSQWFSLDILQNFKAAVGSTVAKATVLRTHGYVAKTAGTSVGGDRIWSGLKVADLDDTSGAVTNLATIPNPRDNPYVDWAYMSRHTTENDLLNLIPNSIGGIYGSSGQGIVIDSKSKRKLENVQDTWAFVLMQDNVGTVASTYHVFFRTLLALP